MKRNTMWIAKGNTEEYGEVFLKDYCGITKVEVLSKIGGVHKAKMLGWEVVEIEFKTI